MKTDLNTQHISTRPLRRDDYDQIVHLLQESIPLAPVGFNWDIRRWEGKCWYDQDSNGDPNWHLNSQVWLTDNAQIIGLAHPDGPGYPYLEVHPDYRHLEMEMIIWAEENLTEAKREGTGRQIHFFVFEYDAHRQRLLSERGYEKMNYGGVTRQLRFGHMPLPQPELSAGYTLRTTNPEDPNDAQQIANLLNVAFKRTFHNAGEYQQFTRRAICFHQELDLVAVAPDGYFAAYVGVPYDEKNRRGMFEPVCTHPEHQQKGLAKALMQEGLLRLKQWGAQTVVVETGDMIPANRLYTSMGFTEIYKGYEWKREWA
ncbi:MAG: GNAT family N-acetyltransferase [Chloroflexi bacterium]|nr:GNAT family N-acetyltransferase [Chloroflexota bacterium]MBP8058952.1 GNAT family N-acetyltransferase [Chloroflexota bacterium]